MAVPANKKIDQFHTCVVMTFDIVSSRFLLSKLDNRLQRIVITITISYMSFLGLGFRRGKGDYHSPKESVGLHSLHDGGVRRRSLHTARDRYTSLHGSSRYLCPGRFHPFFAILTDAGAAAMMGHVALRENFPSPDLGFVAALILHFPSFCSGIILT